MLIRRRNPCIVEIDNELLPDLEAILSGTMRLRERTRVNLLCPISGRRLPLSPEELALVARLETNAWREKNELVRLHEVESVMLESLLERGILLSDDEGSAMTSLREGEARLETVGWHPLAAVYHGMTRWEGVVGDEGSREHNDHAEQTRLQAHIDRHGAIAAHFPDSGPVLAHVELPDEPLQGELARILLSRKTTRHFDRTRSLPLHELSRILRGTFGAMGTQELAPGVVAVKRTSPSGGALHPIEAYPLVMNVEGLASGLYHYRSGDHALALLKAMTETQARSLASATTIAQHYFADAHALVFHVARLERHHWKYRRHPKAYKAVLLDSGHLSQTFYLLATEQGLGAYYTAAINDADVGAALSLDPLSHIPIGANGLGIIEPSLQALHLQPAPWLPTR